jgi:hypothetical protein
MRGSAEVTKAAVPAQMDFAVGHVPGEQEPDPVEQRRPRQRLPLLPQLA